MLARIYRPSKTAMQSGPAHAAAGGWGGRDTPRGAAPRPVPLMGWTVTTDTESSQVRLTFDTKEEAVRYAETHGIAFQLIDPAPAKRIIKAYADNFAFGRRIPWTHCGLA